MMVTDWPIDNVVLKLFYPCTQGLRITLSPTDGVAITKFEVTISS